MFYAATKLFLLAWPLYAFRFVLLQPIPRVTRQWRHHLRAVPLGAVVGLGIGIGILVLARGPLSPLIESGAPSVQEKVRAFGIERHFGLFALALSVPHSLLEEYAWRWFVYGQLSQRSSLFWAHVIAAGAFAAHHVVIASQFFGWGWGLTLGVGVGVGGGIFSWLYQRQDTLVGAWVAHIMVDLALMAIGYQILVGW